MTALEKLIDQWITSNQRYGQRKKVNLLNVEEEIRKKIPAYYEQNGYQLFYRYIRSLEEKGSLTFIQNRKTNGRNPSLPQQAWLSPKPITHTWDKLARLKLATTLNLSYYDTHPEWQTAEEWTRLQSLYAFFHAPEPKEMISIEERSLHLFGHEKFLTDGNRFPEGKGFLQRLQLTAEDIYAHKLGEPFVSWLKPGTQLNEIKTVLIVENMSYFHTASTLLLQKKLPYEPQLIIYGEGKKIERSLSFFSTWYPVEDCRFYYVGDMDPEGYAIAVRLMEKYPHLSIHVAEIIYRQMVQHIDKQNSIDGQQQNEAVLHAFLQHVHDPTLAQAIQQLWVNKTRLPQEVITIENGGEYT